MQTNYLIRLDDACPTMSRQKWDRIEAILDKYGVKPMVGIVPNCKDKKLMLDSPDSSFWIKALSWQDKGWAIALHGYNHCYISDKGLIGLNPLWSRSEFAGVKLEVQRKKISDGISILHSKGLNANYFFAPSHTFDFNTLQALKYESNIRVISDTIARKPYRHGDFVFIPQLGGHCSEMRLPGIWTFCLHPNTMTDESFIQTEDFVKSHANQFISFDQLDITSIKKKDFLSRILSWAYFTQRRIRGIK